MEDRQLYETILGLEEPWYVERVELGTEEEEVRVYVELAEGTSLRCPECGEPSPGYDRSPERRWRHLDTCQYSTLLVARVPRVRCAEHGVRQIRVPWAEGQSRFTALFEALAIRFLRETTVSGLAELMGVSWDEAEGILNRAVARGLRRREREPLRFVGVDETSFQKRHEYVTVVADLEGDRVLWVGDHRRQGTLESYWEGLTAEQREAVEEVVMDMWDPYIAATEAWVPDSTIVFDRYHVVQQLNRAVDEVRRQENRRLREAEDERLKGTKYLWLKGRKRRTRKELLAIRQLRRSGLKVGRAWAIKEAASKLWHYRSPTWAEKYFRWWYYWATHSRLPAVIRVAKMMKKYFDGILAYLRYRHTNALTEGLNSKIQEIKYRARGYRSRDNFRRAILFHCGGLDMNPR
jgi:transposase